MFTFPHFDHIPLPNSPLNEVVCQVQFPPILQISEKPPTEFQDRVRNLFPLFELHHNFEFELSGVPNGQPLTSKTLPTIYRFATMDHASMISLNLQSCGFHTTDYAGWDSFSTNLRAVLDGVESIYQPASATRIGLRYVNLLTPEITGFSDFEAVVRLVRPELIAPFTIPAFPVSEGLSRLVSEQGDQHLSLIFGFVKDETAQRSFVIDLDLFTDTLQPFETEEMMNTCDTFHNILYDAFRWCLVEDSLQVFSSDSPEIEDKL